MNQLYTKIDFFFFCKKLTYIHSRDIFDFYFTGDLVNETPKVN